MIYRFKFVSDEVSNFAREIEIDSEATFLILRNAILDSVGYEKDNMDSFLLCDDRWEGHEEVTITDMGTASDEDIWIMDETPVSELVEEEGQKLRFIFDMLGDRSFYMELAEIIPGKNLSDPVCTIKKGNAPKQALSVDEIDQKVEIIKSKELDDFDEDLYGDVSFNDEDIEGLSEMEDL